MFKRYYKNMFLNPSVIVALSIVFLYSLIPYFDRNILDAFGLSPETNAQKISFFNKNYWSFFSRNAVTFFLMMIYALYCQSSRVFFQKESVIVRFDDHYLYWKRRIIYLLIDTVIFVLFIHILLIIRLFIFNESAEFLKYALSYLLIIPLNIMGFLSFGLIYHFAYAFTGNTVISFLSAYAFVIYDYLAHGLLWPCVYINRAMSVWTQDYSTNIFNLCIMTIALTVLIAVCVSILAKRDCLIPKENKDAA